MVELLVANGANLNAKSELDETPLGMTHSKGLIRNDLIGGITILFVIF